MAVDTTSDGSVDVVIIGGGPTGLFSALLLQQLGVSVLVLDAKPGALDLGRADALNARTQQYLRVAGILDDLLDQGIRCNTSSTFADGEFKSRQNAWWTSITHCEFPNFLMIGQPVVEEVILSKLQAGTVIHNETVSSLVDDTEKGEVTVTTASGRRVHAKYAIAADGARSSTRAGLGISFTGTKPEMTWAVLDCFIETDFPRCSEIITFQLDGQSRVSWIPRERNMARFYVLLDGEITLEKAQESVRRHMAPHTIDFIEMEWYSTFEIKERVASTFISQAGQGRVFLAGDSAHVHAVNGGQGLNTGLADAFALSWRLATVVKDDSIPDHIATDILHSYDSERRAIAQDVINVAAALVRDTMHTAKQYVATIEKNAGYITGMGVSYAGVTSELICSSESSIWVAGQRCPDILVNADVAESPKRLYSLFKYGDWIVLHIGHASKVFSPGKKSSLSQFTIKPCQNPDSESLEVGTLPSTEEGIFTSDAVTAGESFIVVVRPDMYLGFVGDSTSSLKYLVASGMAV